MTNKKLKFAAMSVALTACVAAQPLAANAAENLRPVADDPAPEQNEPSEASSASEETVEEIKNETLNQDPEPSEDMDVKEAFGDDVDIKYDPDKATKDEETGTVTTPGDVIRKEDPDQPGETDETGKTDGSEEAGEVIGSAERNETDESSSNTVTPDPGAPSTPSGPSVSGTDEDGNTTITTPTLTPGTDTTITEGTGSATADNEKKPDVTETAPDDINVKDELGGAEIPWDVKADNEKKIGDTQYVVKDVQNNGDKQTLTLEKTEEKTDKMTPEDIAKLVDANYQPGEEEGTYTLTREDSYIDEDGNEHTVITFIKVNGDGLVTTTTTTVLKLQREKVGHTEAGKVESKIEYPDVTVTNENDGKDSFTIKKEELESLIEQAKKDQNTKTEGKKTTYTTTKDGKTYTITVDESAVETLSDAEIYEKANLDKEKYALEDGKIYYIGNGERVELTLEQKDAFRKTLSITVKVEEDKKGTEDKVEDGKNPDQIKNDVALGSVKDALKNAVDELLKNKTITQEEADALKAKINAATAEDLNTAEGGVFKADNIGKENKSFELKYSGAAVDDKGTPKADTDTKTDIIDHEVNGTAYVIGGKTYWKDQSGTITDPDKDSPVGNLSSNYTEAPANATPGSVKRDLKGRVTEYKIGSKTYTFTYSDLTDEEINALKKQAEKAGWDITHFEVDATSVYWTITEDDTTTTVKAEDTFLGEVKSDNYWTETWDETNRTWTISYKDAKGKTQTISGLTKNKDGTYSKTEKDTTTTISFAPGKTLSTPDVEDLLKKKFNETDSEISEIKVNSDGTATFKKNGILYTVKYDANRTDMNIKTEKDVRTGEKVSGAFNSEKEYLDWIHAEIDKAAAAGEGLQIGDVKIDHGTSDAELIRLVEKVVRYDELEEDDLIKFLQDQKKTSKSPGRKEHVDLDVAADLVDKDTNDEFDAVILDPTFVISSDVTDLVKNGSGTHIDLQDYISYDSASKQNEYKHSGSNSMKGDEYYHVTGTVAYGQLFKDTASTTSGGAGTFSSKADAEKAAREYAEKNGLDYTKLQFVEFHTSQDNRKGGPGPGPSKDETYWKVYEHTATLSAYGYMGQESNTCYIGYDLLLNNLTLVKDKVYAQGKDTTTWSNTLYRTKKDTLDTSTIEGQLLAIKEATYQQTVKGKFTDGTDRYGSYTVDYEQDLSWKDSCGNPTKVKGKAHNSYTTFKDLIHKIFGGKGSGKEEGGSFRYSYKTEKDAELAPVSKTETSVKHAEVKYDYTTIDTAHVLIPGETTVIVPPTTPEDPDLPAPDDETPVVTPETPELPPVQDATPDAEPTTDVVITPATPELPPVQDAAPDVISALPKTGVNWTAAIGMALSGMALMAAGAFTSLFHKAKH